MVIEQYYNEQILNYHIALSEKSVLSYHKYNAYENTFCFRWERNETALKIF